MGGAGRWCWKHSGSIALTAGGASWQPTCDPVTFTSWSGAEQAPERILNEVKAYASRALNRSGLDDDSHRRWTPHGSTRYLWKPEQIGAAMHYVVREQGEPMAVWERPSEPRPQGRGPKAVTSDEPE